MPGLFLTCKGTFVNACLEHHQPVKRLDLNVLKEDSSGALFKEYTCAETIKDAFLDAKEQDRQDFEENNDEDYDAAEFKRNYNKEVCACFGCLLVPLCG